MSDYSLCVCACVQIGRCECACLITYSSPGCP